MYENKTSYLLLAIFILFSAFTFHKHTKIDRNLELFESFFRTLNQHYVDDVNVDKLTRTAINSILKDLDPHSHFFDSLQTQNRNNTWRGTSNYGVIGVYLKKMDTAVVVSGLVEGYDAHLNDVRCGDQIVSINGSNVKDKSENEIRELLKGEINESIQVGFHRYNIGPLHKTLVRKKVKKLAVPFYDMIDKKTAYIKMTHFLNGSSDALKKAFLDLKLHHEPQSLVLDFRGNTGGIVKEAVAAVNLFLAKGKKVVTLKGKNKRSNYEHHTLLEPIDTLIPMVILTDKKTASASELFIGALQDYDRAVLMGQATYGKGFVQGTRKLKFKSTLYVTAARYFTPSGRCIQKYDYSKSSKNQRLITFPDSLKQAFKTKNGRIVYSTGGITPDLILPAKKEDDIIKCLRTNNLFFEYANLYQNQHSKISSPQKFKFSNRDFNNFLNFLEEKNYNFSTHAEEQLESFKTTIAEKESFEEIDESYQEIKQHLLKTKRKEIRKHKEVIKEILQQQIIKRFYAASGNYRAKLKQDKAIKKATTLLHKPKQYNKLLQPKTTIGQLILEEEIVAQ